MYVERKDVEFVIARKTFADWIVSLIFEWPAGYMCPQFIVKTEWIDAEHKRRFTDATFDNAVKAELYMHKKIHLKERENENQTWTSK